MKGPMLRRMSDGKAAVIAMTSAALLLVGCSERENHSKPEQRASTATNAPQRIPDTNSRTGNLKPWESDYADTNTASVGKTNLNPKQIAELRAKAERGDAAAQFKLGECYERTNGVPGDLAEAVKWYHKAAVQGLPEAQHALARAYIWGEGAQHDVEQGRKWLQQAAQGGWAEAQFMLGFPP
jgi:TPR repeat protein